MLAVQVSRELRINLDVPGLATAQACYCAAFGRRPRRRIGDAGVELLGAAAPLWLLALPAGGDAAARQSRHCGCHWTPLHLDVVVPLMEPALARAEAAGMRSETGIHETAWGRLVTTADPSDHRRCPLPFTGDGHDGIARAPA